MGNVEPSSKPKTYLTLGRIGLFYFFGLSIFFISAFTIITLQVSVKDRVEVPMLVGKLYLEEHNRLQRLGIKIEIEKNHSLDYPYGFILGQSVPPGMMLAQGAGIKLIVNFSKTVVTVPQLVGFKLRIAEKILSRIPAGERTYSLKIGKTMEIESDSPAGEILAQNPPANTPVIPGTPIEVLVSKGQGQVPKLNSFSNFKSMEILVQAAYELKVPISLSSANGRSDMAGTLTKESRKAIAGNKTRASGKMPLAASFISSPSQDNISRELTPYSYSWESFNSLSLEEENFTLVRLKKDQSFKKNKALEYNQIDAVWYLSKISQIPLFKRPGTKYLVYEGYLDKTLLPGFETKKEDQYGRYLFPRDTGKVSLPKPIKVIEI
jgi:beta-lactam-binding protein with PASTA domain